MYNYINLRIPRVYSAISLRIIFDRLISRLPPPSAHHIFDTELNLGPEIFSYIIIGRYIEVILFT